MTVVFQAGAFGGNDTGNGGQTNRYLFTPSTGGLDQVRVTFTAPNATFGMQTDHCSIGIDDGSNTGSVTATPIELKFGGVSGFNIAAGATAVSDWTNFTWTAGQLLIAIWDMNAASQGWSDFSKPATTGTAGQLWFKGSTASWNVQTVSGYGGPATGLIYGVTTVEIQSLGPTVDGSVGGQIFRMRQPGWRW